MLAKFTVSCRVHADKSQSRDTLPVADAIDTLSLVFFAAISQAIHREL